MYNVKIPMFAELKDVLKNQNEALSVYKNSVIANTQNSDYSAEYKQKNKLKLDNDYLSSKEKSYKLATELLQKQIVAFNNERIDTDFLVKAKTLGETMPDIALQRFLEDNRGNFRTADALHQIYEGSSKQSIINDYRLKVEKTGERTRYITTEQYVSDLSIAIDNFFGSTDRLPSEMGYKGKIGYGQVVKLLNVGRVAGGNTAIEYEHPTGFNISGRQEVAEPTAPVNTQYNFVNQPINQ